MKLGKIIITLLILILPNKVYSQENVDFEQFIQDLLSFSEENSPDPEIFDILIQYYQHPLNLNKARKSDLESLYLLTPIQIEAFLNYMDEYGSLLSIYELQSIDEFDLETIEILKYFVTVPNRKADNRNLIERLKDPSNHYVLMRYQRQVEKSTGYKKVSETGFLGSPDKYLLRYRLQGYRDYSIGFTMEKDAGEQIKWDPNNNYYVSDFISGHIYKENESFLKKIVIGDYQLQFGQGLLFSSGFNIGKGAETILSVKRNEMGLSPYSSTMEYGFLRGMGVSIGFSDFLLTPFFSQKNVDGKIIMNNDEAGKLEFVNAISETGIHNTQNDLNKRATIKETIYGANLNWSSKMNSMGITFSEQHFNKPIIPTEAFQNKYAFNGIRKRNIGFNYDFLFRNINTFGEMVISDNSSLGILNGLIISMNKNSDISLLYRFYERNFHSIKGAAFGEGTRNNNEKGLYLGFSHQFKKRWKIRASTDVFEFDWLKLNTKSPSVGEEILVRLEKEISKRKHFFFQYRYEMKEQFVSNQQSPELFKRISNEFIFQYQQKVNDQFLLRSRIQSKSVESLSISNGFALSQDIQINLKPFRLDFRTIFFETKDFDSRIYVLEKDLLYSFSAPAYFGNGSRNYAMITYQISSKMKLWLRWARTERLDVNTLGSGNDLSQGNSRNEIKMQWLFRF